MESIAEEVMEELESADEEKQQDEESLSTLPSEMLQDMLNKLQHECDTYQRDAEREEQRCQFLERRVAVLEDQRRTETKQMQQIRSDAQREMQEMKSKWIQHEQELTNHLNDTRKEKNQQILELEERCNNVTERLKKREHRVDEYRMEYVKNKGMIRNLNEQYQNLKRSSDLRSLEIERQNKDLRRENEILSMELKRVQTHITNYEQMENALDRLVPSDSDPQLQVGDRYQHKQQYLLMKIQRALKPDVQRRNEVTTLKQRMWSMMELHKEQLRESLDCNARLNIRIHDLENLLSAHQTGSKDHSSVQHIDAISSRDVMIAKLRGQVNMLKMSNDRRERVYHQ